MIKRLILSTLFLTYVFGGNLEINDKIGLFSLPDQFDKIHSVDKNISTIIVSFQKNSINDLTDYFSKKDRNFLNKNHTACVYDVSLMPSVIFKLFVLPKMRDLKQEVFIIYDENSSSNKRFLKQKNRTTIYSLKDGLVTKIEYISTAQELDKFLK